MTDVSPIDRRWKYPAIPSKIRREITRPDPAAIAVLASYDVPSVCDVVGRMYTMHGIGPLYTPIKGVAGPAVTVRCPPGDNLGVKLALTLVQPGDVLVVDAQGFTDWCLGGFQMLALPIAEQGLSGLVVHGAYRDALEAKDADFPIFATANSPWSGPKVGPVEVNVPVCCGGVIVHPGDVVTASVEGIAIVPAAHLNAVIDRLAADKAKFAAQGRQRFVKQNEDMAAYIDEMRRLGLAEDLT
jgi:4-hydroxy-4-methyl-2-oxoglutarate aldolase